MNSPRRSHAVRVGQRFGIGREHVRDELRAEGGAEHGGVAEQRAVARREPVDARRDDGLDALGQRLFLGSRARTWRAPAGTAGCRRARSAMAATSCWSMPSAAAAPISSRDSSADSGCSWIVIAGIGGTPSAAEKPPSTARRVTQISQGLPETCVPRWRSSSDDASSIQCASSTTSKVGFRSRSDSSFSITPWSRARRNAGCSSSTSCVGSTADVEHEGDQRQPGKQLGVETLDLRAAAASAAVSSAGRSSRARRIAAEREVRSRGLVLLADGGEARRGRARAPAAPRRGATCRGRARRSARPCSRSPCARGRAPRRRSSARARGRRTARAARARRRRLRRPCAGRRP